MYIFKLELVKEKRGQKGRQKRSHHPEVKGEESQLCLARFSPLIYANFILRVGNNLHAIHKRLETSGEDKEEYTKLV